MKGKKKKTENKAHEDNVLMKETEMKKKNRKELSNFKQFGNNSYVQQSLQNFCCTGKNIIIGVLIFAILKNCPKKKKSTNFQFSLIVLSERN